jgi:hypothetical protein
MTRLATAAVLVAGMLLSGGGGAVASERGVSLVTALTQVRLYVAQRDQVRRADTAAWVIFRTNPRLRDARLIVVRVPGGSGRSYRSKGTHDCIRSAVVTSTGRIGLEPGRRYAVRFYFRSGTGMRAPRTLFATRIVTARTFRVLGAQQRTPTCTPTRLTANAAMRRGIRAWARTEGAVASQVVVNCLAVRRVGERRGCRGGNFRLERDGRSADYRLTSRAGNFRNSPGSIQYILAAITHHPVRGLPRAVDGFSGFLQ